jgi:hypothetical protein
MATETSTLMLLQKASKLMPKPEAPNAIRAIAKL